MYVYIKMVGVASFPMYVYILMKTYAVYGCWFATVTGLFTYLIMPVILSIICYDPLFIEDTEYKIDAMKQRKNKHLDILDSCLNMMQPGCICVYTLILSILFNVSAVYRNYEKDMLSSKEERQVRIENIIEQSIDQISDKYGPLKSAPDSGFVETEDNLWIANLTGLKNLRKNVYDSADTYGRLKALKLILDIEIYSLTGERNTVGLSSVDFNDGIQGAYYPQANMIFISNGILNDRDAAIECVIHEAKHVHQKYAIALLDSLNILDSRMIQNTSIGNWQYENENYHNGEDGDYSAYYMQDVEMDSRAYAYRWARNYILFIDRITSDGVVDITGLEVK